MTPKTVSNPQQSAVWPLMRKFAYTTGLWVCLQICVLYLPKEVGSDLWGLVWPWEPKQSPLRYFAPVISSVMIPMNLGFGL